jgi:hypothetical protein
MMKVLGLLVGLLCLTGAFAKTRKYYVRAEEKMWDFAPTGMNNFDGTSISSGDAGLTRVPIACYRLKFVAQPSLK